MIGKYGQAAIILSDIKNGPQRRSCWMRTRLKASANKSSLLWYWKTGEGLYLSKHWHHLLLASHLTQVRQLVWSLGLWCILSENRLWPFIPLLQHYLQHFSKSKRFLMNYLHFYLSKISDPLETSVNKEQTRFEQKCTRDTPTVSVEVRPQVWTQALLFWCYWVSAETFRGQYIVLCS